MEDSNDEDSMDPYCLPRSNRTGYCTPEQSYDSTPRVSNLYHKYSSFLTLSFFQTQHYQIPCSSFDLRQPAHHVAAPQTTAMGTYNPTLHNSTYPPPIYPHQPPTCPYCTGYTATVSQYLYTCIDVRPTIPHSTPIEYYSDYDTHNSYLNMNFPPQDQIMEPPPLWNMEASPSGDFVDIGAQAAATIREHNLVMSCQN